jgi:transposase InsO family protein
MIRALHRVRWLTDNVSIFAAYRTLKIATALNLESCFTLVESPESNGMAETFVKTFKRDYVRVNPIPGASTALSRIDQWTEDYNSPALPSGLPLTKGVHCLTSTGPRVRSNGVNSTWSPPAPPSKWPRCK